MDTTPRSSVRRLATGLMAACLWLTALTVSAQNTTNLPTSMYGIGELVSTEGGRYAGMGNVGIAVNRIGFQNTLNPASITRMDTTCFTFDVGATASYARYSFLSEQSSDLSGNPNRFSLGLRVAPRWYLMVGAAPYSSCGYLIYSGDEVEGMVGTTIYSLFAGEGGLYRFYATNAFILNKHLSVGVNVGMVLGKTTQSETQESAVVSYTSKQKAFYGDIGLYYEVNITPRQRWAAGVVFSPRTKIYRDNDLTYYNSSTSEELDKVYHFGKIYLPMHIGGGLSVTTPRWVVTADYNYVDWSKNTSNYTSMRYENQHKINVGGIYVTKPRLPRSTEYMAGLGFSNSYINLKNGKMYYLEGSLGVSFPIRYSFLSVGATYRQQINSRKGMMQEGRVTVNVNVTFGERISKSRLR